VIDPIEIDYNRPHVSDYQRKILDSEARYTVVEASTKTGKTASHIVWLLEQALNPALKENDSVWWVAPVYAQAEIAYKRMKTQMPDKDFFKTNEGKLTLTLPTGVHIQFKSADKPDNLYGDDVYAAVFDEFTRAKEEAWFALRTTLTATQGKCKFIGNVKGKKNWGYRLSQEAKSGKEGYEYFKITAYDAAEAGFITFEEIESAKRDLPDLVFKELYLAEASEDGTNPFGQKFINMCTQPMSSLPPICYGIDLANSVDYAVIIGLDALGQTCYFDRFRKIGWGNTKERIIRLPKLSMRIDSTGVGDPIVEDIEALNPLAKGFKFTPISKQQIIEALAMAIQQRKTTFPEYPKGTIPENDPGNIKFELENFEFEYTRTGVRYTAPAGMHDDCVCALALAWDVHKGASQSGAYSWV